MINSVHIYPQVLTNIFNIFVKSGKFPNILKNADIIPVFKKDDATDKTNYKYSLKFLKSFLKNDLCLNQFIYGTQTIQTPSWFLCKT